MRIDLCLQGIKLCDSQIFSGFCLIIHQLVHFSCHIVVGVDQITYLIVIYRAVHSYRRSLADLTHLSDHRRDTSCNRTGKPAGQEQGKDEKKQIEKSELHHHLITLGNQWFGGQDRYHKPAWLIDPVKAGVDFIAKDVFFDKIIGRHKGLGNILVSQPVNTGQGFIRRCHQAVSFVYNIGNAVL